MKRDNIELVPLAIVIGGLAAIAATLAAFF